MKLFILIATLLYIPQVYSGVFGLLRRSTLEVETPRQVIPRTSEARWRQKTEYMETIHHRNKDSTKIQRV